MAQATGKSDERRTESMMLNLGPSHPAMHGVIRIITELEGERVTEAEIEIGYLHRCFEKSCEEVGWGSSFPYTDRLNYVSPLINNVGYALAVEKLFGVTTPERCLYIRVIQLYLFYRLLTFSVVLSSFYFLLPAVVISLFLVRYPLQRSY